MLSRGRIRGSTGPAAVSVWMSKLADQYTMLCPYRDDATALSFPQPVNSSATSINPCNYTSQFNYYNATLGDSTISPDGANDTARKIVENTSNSEHYIQAGLFMAFGGWPVLRVAGIFKAAGRTRIAFQCWSRAFFPGATPTMTVGFDLAGGQIAYGATYEGPGPSTFYFTLVDQRITPVGDGFYLCVADVQAVTAFQSQGIQDGLSYRFLIDNGSGTAAKSTSYIGTGSLGVYGWKHSVLPRTAWEVNSVCFFDDFDDPTMANIDLQNTLAPGFEWYTSMKFSDALGDGWTTRGPISPLAPLSVTDSVLKVPYQPNPPGAPVVGPGGITTFSHLNGSERGQGWRAPVVFETRLRYDYPNVDQPGNFSWWFGPCEFAMSCANLEVGTNYSPGYFEFDPCEFAGSGFAMGPSIGGGLLSHPVGIVGIAFGGSFGPFTYNYFTSNIRHYHGWPPWQQAWALSGAAYTGSFATVEHNNHYYFMSAFTAAEPPGGNWVEFFYPNNVPGPIQPYDPLMKLSLAEFNVYTFMVLAYNPNHPTDRGCMLTFFNGAFRSMITSWSPTVNPVGEVSNSVQQAIADPQRIFCMFNFNQLTGLTGSYDIFVDYFKVLQ